MKGETTEAAPPGGNCGFAPCRFRRREFFCSNSNLLRSLLAFIAAIALTFSLPAVATAQTYAALDPRGDLPNIQRIPLSPRIADLSGKRIYIVQSWEGGRGGFDPIAADLTRRLQQRFPGVKVTLKERNVRYSEDDPRLWAEMKANADAFVYLVAPSSSTTSYAFKWSAKLEGMGLPGTVVFYDTLTSVRDATNLREGAPVRSVAFAYPIDTIAAATRAAQVEEVIETLRRPLTAGEARRDIVPPPSRPRVAVNGDLAAVQRFFHERGWTDGLPVIPPTEAAVAAMLKGTSHRPDEVVSQAFMPESLRVTVRHVAINAVMAGCEPQHMPVLLAAIEAAGKWNLNSMLRSTNSFAFMQVVNGPIAREIGMNGGVNAVGPGNHANAVIGRAFRLFIINLGGGEPGLNIMAVIGNNANYSLAFAENEAESPWPSFAESRGFKKAESTLTLFSGGWAHSGNFSEGTTLADAAKDMARYQIPSGALLIISPKRAEALARQGYDRARVRDELWREAARPVGETRRVGFRDQADLAGRADTDFVPLFPKDSIEVVVAGGDGAPMMQAWSFYRPQTISIDKWR